MWALAALQGVAVGEGVDHHETASLADLLHSAGDERPKWKPSDVEKAANTLGPELYPLPDRDRQDRPQREPSLGPRLDGDTPPRCHDALAAGYDHTRDDLPEMTSPSLPKPIAEARSESPLTPQMDLITVRRQKRCSELAGDDRPRDQQRLNDSARAPTPTRAANEAQVTGR